MSTIEERTRQAFSEVHVPELVKQESLAFIEAQRITDEAGESTCAARAHMHDSTPEGAKERESLRPEPALRRTPRIHRASRTLAVAACLIVALMLFGGIPAHFAPTAYIDVDVNPSIELTVNRFDRVIEVKALNEDGQAIVDTVDVKHEKAQVALESLTSSEAFAPYMTDESYVSISVVSENANQAASLEATGNQVVSGLPCSGCCQTVDAHTWQAAQEAHMGVGRYLAALQLMKLDPSVTLEQCSTMTMRELRDRIEELGGSFEGTGGNGNGNGRGPGAGQGKGDSARLRQSGQS